MRFISQFRKWAKIHVWLLATIPVLSQGQSSLAGMPFVRNFQTADYKAGLQNFNIRQDKQGLLYVANNYGLLQFDGTEWNTYGVKSGTKVRSLAIDGRGRIYVGCQGDFGYFFPDQKGNLVYTSLADSLDQQFRNFEETWNVYIDQERVYFCTFSTLFIYNGQSIQVIQPKESLDHSYLVNRQLFVNQRNLGIAKLEGETLRNVEGGEFFKDMSVSSVLSMPGNHYLLSSYQHGIFVLDGNQPKPWNNKNQDYFKSANINCMIRLKNGHFAAGTQNEGVLILDSEGNIRNQLTRERGLLNRTVLNLYEDDRQNLWVGQNNAIACISLESPFSFIKEQSGLPGIGYAAFLDNNDFYLGTNTGLYWKNKNASHKFSLVKNSEGQVYHIGKYGNDVLVAHQAGAMRLENGKTVGISSVPGSWVFLPLREHPDKLLEGTFTGLQLYEMKNGHWQWKKRLEGFPESSRVMAEDQDGHIWVTHGYKGAYRIKLNSAYDSILQISFYGSDKGFPTNRLINVFRIRNELVFTSESGTYKYDARADRFVPDGLFSELIGQGSQLWFMQEDALGNIYFIGREHIGALQKNALGDYVLYESEFNKIRKYLNDDLQNITVMSNNEVLFAAKEGFIHFDPAGRLNKKSNFQTLIRRVTTGDSVLFHGSYRLQDSVVFRQLPSFKAHLPYSDNNINFTFSATSFESDDDLMYQFYLENFEKTWSNWTATTSKEYTNLKEGTYTFHVRAKDVKGEITAIATYEFSIAPPWYRSGWAYAGIGMLTIGFLFSSYKLMSRKYKRERRMMVLKQKRELLKKDTEMEKFSSQTQNQITRLQNEKLEVEINHTKNELATATMHLLNKNEFITSVKLSLTQIIKKSDQADLNKELQKIARDIEANISDDSDWEHFQFHFDRVHGDFITRLKATYTSLSPQETKLCAYLRMNLSSKEIAHLLNISIRGVEIGRYRLRKKLMLDREKNLQEFILNF